MPAEIRHIVFSRQEVAEAVNVFLSKTGRLAPPSQVTTISTVAAPEARLDVTAVDGNGARQIVKIEQSDVLAAVLLYAREKRLPLPRRAPKLLDAVEGAVALTVCLEVEEKRGEMWHRIFRECHRLFTDRVRAAA